MEVNSSPLDLVADGHQRAVLERLEVGIIVERCAGRGFWPATLWRAVAVLSGRPAAEPWTRITEPVMGRELLYAGSADVELCRSETPGYRANVTSSRPCLWVCLREDGTDGRVRLAMVTADPATGEALTGAGRDVVDAIPMPHWVEAKIASFIDRHPIDETFFRRKRDDPGRQPAMSAHV